MKRMIILPLFLLFFSLAGAFGYSETVMVTMVDVGMAPAEEEGKEKAGDLENGLMDSLFENGIIFFTSSCRKSVDEMKDGKASLVQASQSGASYLVEVSLDQEDLKIFYGIYDIEGKGLLAKGEIEVPEGTLEEQKDFCRKSGSTIAKELYKFLE